MKGKNKINIVFLLTSLFFIILFSGYVSASCMIQGQVFSEEGTPLNGINVNVSIDGNNPSQTTTSSGVFGEGYYEQSFESECVQGDSSVYVKAYNSTHYGENTTTADSSAETWIDVTLDQEIPQGQEPVNINITFSGNGTTVVNDNYTIEAGEELNVTARINISDYSQINDTVFKLFKDGVSVGSITDNYIEFLNSSLAVGTYYFKSVWEGNPNYKSFTRDPTVTVQDTTPPKYYNVNDDSNGIVLNGTQVNISVFWEDAGGLGYAETYYNYSSGVDDSISNCAFSSTSGWCNRTIDTSSREGEEICWWQYGYDDAGEYNTSMENNALCFDVTDKPNEPRLNNPENDSKNVILKPFLNVTIPGAGENYNVTFYNKSGTAFSSECSDIPVGTTEWVGCEIGYLLKDTTYEWYANVTDGFSTVSSIIWNFTTLSGNSPPEVYLNYPNDTEEITTASPVLNVTLTDYEGNETNVSFYQVYQNGDRVLIDDSLTNIPNGSYATYEWSGRSSGGSYKWYVNVTDGNNRTISDEWTFSVQGNNVAPNLDDFDPFDNEENVRLYKNISVEVRDINDDNMYVSFYNASDNSIFSGCENIEVYENNKWVDCDLGILDKNTVYEWYVNVTDSEGNYNVSSNKSFTTLSGNSPPEILNLISPEDGNEDTASPVLLNVTITDYEGNSTNVTFYNSTGGLIGYEYITDEFDLRDGTYATTTWSGLEYGKRYKWYVEADDGENTTISTNEDSFDKLWNFTTQGPFKPEIIFPENNSVIFSNSTTLNVTIGDPDNNPINVTFYNVTGGTPQEICSYKDISVYGDYVSCNWENLEFNESYQWYVNVTDGYKERSTEISNFSVKNISGIDRWDEFLTPQGVYVPEDEIGGFSGTQLSTFGIEFKNLTISSDETLNCDIKQADGSILSVNTTGKDLLQEDYSLNYTVSSSDSIINSNDGYLPWVLKNCSIEKNDNLVFNESTSTWDGETSRRIYTHSAGVWTEEEYVRAGDCRGSSSVYFNNTMTCTRSDTNYVFYMYIGEPITSVENDCSSEDRFCKSIFYPRIRPVDYITSRGYSATTDDPNGYTTFPMEVGSYTSDIAYTSFVNSSGSFKLRVKQNLPNPVSYTIGIYNLTNVSESETNVYAQDIENGTINIEKIGGETGDVVSYKQFERTHGTFQGDLDITFNISFNDDSLNKNINPYLYIIYGDQSSDDNYFTVNFSSSNGLRNYDESETSSWTTGFSEGPVCGDEVNNDFDYLDGIWSNSYDCFDLDCNMSQGDNDQTNEFGSGQTGLCNYGTELNCTDRFDNDYDSLLSGSEKDYTDCHDSDCFQNDPACPATETTCNDGINNDWDYTLGETDDSSDEKIENNGTKYDSDAGYGSNLTDCEDLDCNGSAGTGGTCEWGYELTCNDGFDNDDLQLKDCELNTVSGPGHDITPADAEYDCSEYCRTDSGNITETGEQCFDGIDNDWDALNITGYYSSSDSYDNNDVYGAGIDCRWGGYFGYGDNYNPDEDCDGEVSDEGNECQLERETNCTDEFDNDYDFYAQGSNPMPSAGWSNNETAYENYYNQTYKEDADFDDYDCAGHEKVPDSEAENASFCFDEIDNDLDAYYWNGSTYKSNDSTGIDCADPDCVGVEDPNSDNVCLAAEYNASDSFFTSLLWPGKYCADEIDNDADGPADCSDSDCFQQFGICSRGPCYKTENISWNSCADGQDNDGGMSSDGIDCSDSDCYDNNMLGNTNGAVCQATETDCSDGFDNDDNGLVDCEDPNCIGEIGGQINNTNVYCNSTAENNCSDGFDNDGDGDIDYYDTDCDVYSGLSDVSGTSVITLPREKDVTLESLDAYARDHTYEVKKGEDYSVTLISNENSVGFITWAIGTSGDPLNSSYFDFSTASISGPDASDFSLSQGANGFIIGNNTAGYGPHEIVFSIETNQVTSGEESFQLSLEQAGDGSLANFLNYTIQENTNPSIDNVAISPSENIGVYYGDKLQVRANASDNEQFGECRFEITGPENHNFERTDCKLSFAPQKQGEYTIDVTPVDKYSNIGTTWTETYNLNIKPKGYSINTNRRFYSQEFHTLDISSVFNLSSSDYIDDCNITAENDTHTIILETSTSIAGNGNNCSSENINLSSLSNGLYEVYSQIKEENSSEIIKGESKAIFVCHNSTEGMCGFTNFDENYQPDMCDSGDIYAPEINSRSPSDGYNLLDSYDEGYPEYNVLLSVNVSDQPDGNNMSVVFFNSSGDYIYSDYSVTNNGVAQYIWKNLSQGKIYQWYVNVTDAFGNVKTSEKWDIVVMGNNSYPNKPILPKPENNKKGVSLYTDLSVYVEDPDGDELNVSFYNSSNDQAFDSCENIKATNGSRVSCDLGVLEKNTTYKWYVNVTDGILVNSSNKFNFTTLKGNSAPHVVLNYPNNTQELENTFAELNVTVLDYEGNQSYISFYDNTSGSPIKINETHYNVNNGSIEIQNWTGLSKGMTYSWFVNVSDSENYSVSEQWNFSIKPENNAPTIDSFYPINNKENVSLYTDLRVQVSDPDVENMSVTFYNASNDQPFAGCDNISVENNNWAECNLYESLGYALEKNTTYKWYANVTDGDLYYKSNNKNFTTLEGNSPPYIELNYPEDMEEGVSTSPLLNITVLDYEGKPMNVSFYNSTGGIINKSLGVSNGNVVYNWDGLENSSLYEWYVNVTDGNDTVLSTDIEVAGKKWEFTTSYDNNDPIVLDYKPYSGKTDVSLYPELEVKAEDLDDDPMYISFYDNLNGQTCSNILAENDEWVSCDLYEYTGNALPKGFTFEWHVRLADGTVAKDSETWNFTTLTGNSPPHITLNFPENDSITESNSPVLNFTLEDYENQNMNFSVYNSTGGILYNDTNITSGETINFTWSDLENGKYYDWYLNVTDGDNTTYEHFSFRTPGPAKPVLNSPGNGKPVFTDSPLLNVTVSNPQNDSMNVTFYNITNPGNPEVLCSNNSVYNGPITCNWNDLEKGNVYNWYVNVTDGNTKTKSDEWNFTVAESGICPEIIHPRGIYEPLCCGSSSNPTSKTGQECIDDRDYNISSLEGDVYCEGSKIGEDISYNLKHVMPIKFSNLTISSSKELECTIEQSNGSLIKISKTGLDLDSEDYVMNYTLSYNDSIIRDTGAASIHDIPWYIHNCTVKDTYGTLERVQNISKRIYVHKNLYWTSFDYQKAVLSESVPHKFFNNTAISKKFLIDSSNKSYERNFAYDMLSGTSVEGFCYDGIDNDGDGPIDENDINCLTFTDTHRDLSFYGDADLNTRNVVLGYSVSDITTKDSTNDEDNLVSDSLGGTDYEYTVNTNSDGSFKMRIYENPGTEGYSYVLKNMPQIDSAMKIGSGPGFSSADLSDSCSGGTCNIAYDCTGDPCKSGGNSDIVLVINFSDKSLEGVYNVEFEVTHGLTTESESFNVYFDSADGLTNLDESESSGITDSTMCDDNKNNDLDISSDYSIINNKNPFDQIGFSRDCADSDCSGEIGPSIDGNSGDCEYKTETICDDGYDNDFNDNYTQDLHWLEDGVAYADCHDADCFQNDPACPATETICDDGINNDWDYTIGESDSPSDEKVNNSGTKYDHETYTAELTDCEDEDCDGSAGAGGTCEWGHELSCDDGFNNDALQVMDCERNAGGQFNDLEYDCASHCRSTVQSTETGNDCNDGIDNDWDLYEVTGDFYSGTENTSDGAGMDCVWTGNNPDEDCDGETVDFDDGTGTCELGTELTCDDGIDNDRDEGHTSEIGWNEYWYEDYFGSGTYSENADCDDTDCAGSASSDCPNSEGENPAWCFDGVDNDNDGDVDCEDDDCAGAMNPAKGEHGLNYVPYCAPYEINTSLLLDSNSTTKSPNFCGNQYDDEQDTGDDTSVDNANYNSIGQSLISDYADCNDEDCHQKFKRCAPCSSNEYVEWNSCFDGLDNDRDGSDDSGDTDCDNAVINDRGYVSSTMPSNENCMNQYNDNSNSGGFYNNPIQECQDNTCNGEVFSPDGRICSNEGTESTCDDGLDNDLDGSVDCYDNDCYSDCGISPYSGGGITHSPKNESYTLTGDFSANGGMTSIVRRGNALYASFSYSGNSGAIDIRLGSPNSGEAFDTDNFDISAASFVESDGFSMDKSFDFQGQLQFTKGPVSSFDFTVKIPTKGYVQEPQTITSTIEVNGVGTSQGSIDVQIVNNQEPEIGSIRVEPEEGSSGSGKITVGDNIQIIGGDFAGYDGGQTNSGKPGRCLIEINGPSIPVGSAFENDCKAEWDIGSGGTYDVTITPYDNTGLAGDPITKTLDLDVAPKISLPLSRGGNKRVHFNDTISSFDQEFGENPKTGKKITGEMAAKFETGNSIGYGSGSCEALIYDQSGSLIDTQTISQSIEDKSLPGSIDKEIELTCNVDASVSGLDDGMYYLKVRATDSDNNELTTQRKVFYICNDLTSAGTNWNCSLADFDADGYTDGIKQPFNYSDGSGGLQKLSCDSCPTKVNAGEDADMDGIDAACDPDEDPSDYIATPITPANEETGVNTSTVLEVSVIDTKGGDPMNVSFYNAADDSLIGYDENVASGDEASVLWANLLSGTSYSWYVIVDDGSIVGNSETWSFTTAGDGDDDSGSSSGGVSGGGGGFGGVANTAPEVTLNSPGINELFSSTSVEFNCSVNDTDANLANVSLKIDGLVVDTIDALPSTSLETYTWTRTLENGLYNWTCKAVDDAGASTEPIARDFEVNTSADTTSPVLNIIFPGNKTYDDPVSELNYTYEEDNPEKCWYSVDSGLTNSSSVEMGINFTNVTSETGLNNWTLYCNDSNGNVGSDEISFRVRGFRWIYLILGLILLFIAFMFYSYLVYRKEKKKYPKIRKMRFDEWLVHKMSVGIKKTGEFFKRAWKKIKRDTKLLFTHPKQFFREKGQAIKKGFRNLGKWFRKVGKNIKIGFQNLGKWFNKQARNIKEFFKNLFKKKK